MRHCSRSWLFVVHLLLPPQMGLAGMNATFLTAVRANGGRGSDIRTASGAIPGHVHPPADGQ